MPNYLVKWEIEIEAPDPRSAALEAQDIQRDPESWATVYSVNGVMIDLQP